MEELGNPYSDFDRLDYFILGILLHQSYSSPGSPYLSNKEISKWLPHNGPIDLIADKVQILEDLDFVVQGVVPEGGRPEDGMLTTTRISTKGVAFLLNNADRIAEQIHGLTWDMPDEIEESLYALLSIGDPLLATKNIQAQRFVPTASRYVSVKDNQPAFDEIRKNLSIIRDEFSADHNKRELPVENLDGAIAEIDAFSTAIESNWVSRPMAMNLLESLQYFESIFVSSSKILAAVTAAIASLKIIIGLM